MKRINNKNIRINEYVQDENNNIFIRREDDFLKLSPWNNNEDRRIFDFENKTFVNKLNKNKAYEILNQQFRNHTSEWQYNGYTFKTDKCFMDYSIKERNEIISQMQEYTPHEKYCYNKWHIVEYKGKLFYAQIKTQYFPRIPLTPINSNDKSMRHCWGSFKYLKPIRNITIGRWT